MTEHPLVAEWLFDPKQCYVDLLKVVMDDRGFGELDMSLLTDTPVELIRSVIDKPKKLTAWSAEKLAITQELNDLAQLISGKGRKWDE